MIHMNVRFAITKITSHNNLPSEKILPMYNVVILLKSVFDVENKHRLQLCLEEHLCKLAKL